MTTPLYQSCLLPFQEASVHWAYTSTQLAVSLDRPPIKAASLLLPGALPENVCYGSPMRTAYLGIADEHRLLAWAPECDTTRRFLERRQRVRPRQYCFWVVLDDSDARRIATWQRFGESEVALSFLLQTAEEFGRVLPVGSDMTCRSGAEN